MEKDQNYLSPSFHSNLVVFWFSYPVNVFLFIYFFNKQCVGFGFYFLFNCGLLKKKITSGCLFFESDDGKYYSINFN